MRTSPSHENGQSTGRSKGAVGGRRGRCHADGRDSAALAGPCSASGSRGLSPCGRRLRPWLAGDGRLTHDLLPGEKGPQDACGVFGVWAPGEEVAKLTYFGLYALQHRGQESAGIAVSDGSPDRGLQGHGPGLPGLRRGRAGLPAAATSRSATPATPPPAPRPGRTRSRPSAPPRPAAIALGHNGNLINTGELAELLADPRRTPASSTLPGGTPTGRRPPATPTWSPRCWPATRTAPLEASGAGGAAAAARRVLPRLHGRDDALRRPRPAGHPPAGARPAGARLGGGQRDRRARHRRRQLRPRGRAGRADRDRRGRPAHRSGSPRPSPRAACSSTSTWPARTPRSPAATCTRPGSRSAAGWPARHRSRPTW